MLKCFQPDRDSSDPFLIFIRKSEHLLERVILIEISRSLATSSQPSPPEERAAEIINKLPSSPNLITKTGTAILGTGLAAAAISQELYVFNEETIILIASAIFFTFLAKVLELSLFRESC